MHEVINLLERIERRNRNIQFRVIRMERKLMSAFTDLKASVEAYIAANEAKDKTIAEAVAAAVAADDAGEDVELNALNETVKAAIAKVTPPVIPPAA